MTLTAGTLSGSSTLNANGGMLDQSNDWPVQSGRPHGQQRRRPDRDVDRRTQRRRDIQHIEASDGSVFNNLGTFVVDGNATYNESGIGAASVFSNAGSFTLSPSAASWESNVPFNVPGGSVDIQDNGQLDLDKAVRAQPRRLTSNQTRMLETRDSYHLRHGHDHHRQRWAAERMDWCCLGTTRSRVRLLSTRQRAGRRLVGGQCGRPRRLRGWHLERDRDGRCDLGRGRRR